MRVKELSIFCFVLIRSFNFQNGLHTSSWQWPIAIYTTISNCERPRNKNERERERKERKIRIEWKMKRQSEISCEQRGYYLCICKYRIRSITTWSTDYNIIKLIRWLVNEIMKAKNKAQSQSFTIDLWNESKQFEWIAMIPSCGLLWIGSDIGHWGRGKKT